MKDQNTTREQRKAVAKMLKDKAREMHINLSIVTEDYFVRVKCFTSEQKAKALMLLAQFDDIHHMQANIHMQDSSNVQILLL